MPKRNKSASSKLFTWLLGVGCSRAPQVRRRITGFLAALVVFPSAVLGTALAAPAALPDFQQVKVAHRSSDVLVLDRHGRDIAVLRRDFSERRGQWVPLEQISPSVQRAVLLSEDRHFHQHAGVDWTATVAAGWGWVKGDSSRGASTISMQLVGMLDATLRRPAAGRTVIQKIAQIRRARELEAGWSKAQILEAYLNLVAFRGELRGIDAVSRVMFGKYPHGLDMREAAVAAALLRGPNAAVQTVVSRACALLIEMAQASACDALPYLAAQWLPTTATPAVDTPQLAPHFARWALARNHVTAASTALHTSLDAGLQAHVVSSVRRHLAGMGQTHLTDAAVVVLDNASGEILAYVGAADATSSAALVDHARARRQAGSTLKPFLYAQALEQRYLTAASLLMDAPLDVSTASGLYIPQNYDRSHVGLVSARRALASSLNIPAVRVLMLVGPEHFAETLRNLDLPLVHDGDYYGYSLALGSADIDLLSLTNAYRALANNGYWSLARVSVTSQAMSAEGRQVFNPMVSWLVGDILADRRARAGSFGLENVLATRFWAAVKTGTSKDMRDNWTIGWSSRYTVGVWVGNSQGLSMREVSGVSGAAPIWHEVISHLHAENVGLAPPPPSGLVSRRIEFDRQIEPSRIEYFMPGTAMNRVKVVQPQPSVRARILYPANQTIVAFDPDMPSAHQRMLLRAQVAEEEDSPLVWQVDGLPVGEGEQVLWQPLPGQWRITLHDQNARVLDAVVVQVRGVPGMQPPGLRIADERR